MGPAAETHGSVPREADSSFPDFSQSLLPNEVPGGLHSPASGVPFKGGLKHIQGQPCNPGSSTGSDMKARDQGHEMLEPHPHRVLSSWWLPLSYTPGFSEAQASFQAGTPASASP